MATENDPNERQVGGSHYKTTGHQHWDFAELDHLSYLEGCATKYLARSRKKHADPTQDLEKAAHYTEKLISLVEQGLRAPREKPTPPPISVEKFVEKYELTPKEATIVHLIFGWRIVEELRVAVKLINHLIPKR